MNGELSSQPDFDAFSVNAAWEPSDDRMRCRWFVAWQFVAKDQIAGAIAGYSGGETFEVEQFWAEFDAGSRIFDKCWIDCTDRVRSEDIDFSSLTDNILAVCKDASALLWEWNDNTLWNELDCVYLRAEHKRKLVAKRGMWRLEAPSFEGLNALCSHAGLTVGPSE